MNKKVISIAVIVVIALAGIGYVALNGDKATQNNEVATNTSDQSSDSSIASKTEQQTASPAPPAAGTATSPAQQTPARPGAYITYTDYTGNKANYDSGKVVYFFNAKWCPTCQALTKDITAKQSAIPAGVTLVSVDYDQYTDLKKQYGVTYQHTLVQVDKDGAQLKKWSGSPDLSAVLSQI